MTRQSVRWRRCTALGKCLLAFQEPARRVELIAAMKLEPFTRRTITQADGLNRNLKQIRRERFGLDDEEFSVGVRCAADPVFDHAGAISCAFGVSGPCPRVTEEKLSTWTDLIRKEAEDLSCRLDYDANLFSLEEDVADALAEMTPRRM